MPLTDTAAAGVAIPDTRLAREATELIRDRTDDLIYHHSRRVYFWGSLQGRNRGLSWDPELLYLGAMFHDLGLNAEFRTSGRRFEVDSADEAGSFMRSACDGRIAVQPTRTGDPDVRVLFTPH